MMKDEDFKLLRGFDYGQTDEQTFVIVESLSRLKINYIAVAQCDLSSQFKVFHSFSRKVRTKNQHQLTLLYPGGRNYKSIVKKIWLKRMCIQLNDSFMGSIDYFKSNT